MDDNKILDFLRDKVWEKLGKNPSRAEVESAALAMVELGYDYIAKKTTVDNAEEIYKQTAGDILIYAYKLGFRGK